VISVGLEDIYDLISNFHDAFTYLV